MTLGEIYELGQFYSVYGNGNWFVIVPALLAFAAMWIVHLSSGRSL